MLRALFGTFVVAAAGLVSVLMSEEANAEYIVPDLHARLTA